MMTIKNWIRLCVNNHHYVFAIKKFENNISGRNPLNSIIMLHMNQSIDILLIKMPFVN